MSLAQPRTERGPFRGNPRHACSKSRYNNTSMAVTGNTYNNYHQSQRTGLNHSHNHNKPFPFSRVFQEHNHNVGSRVQPEVAPPLKKRKFSATSWENSGRQYQHPDVYDDVVSKYQFSNGPHNNVPSHYAPQNNRASLDISIPSKKNDLDSNGATRQDTKAYTSTSSKRDRSEFEDDADVVFMSRDEIEKSSPSRKDGIDSMHEMHLRYSYCAFLQNLGIRLELPQTTIGSAMVLCHRFFLRRSHASHDRFLIATAALFLAAKFEETARPLNDLLKASCEIFHKQDITLLSYVLPLDWFDQYRERIIEAEQLILTTLNFELTVQHPYDPLISTLEKLGFSQSALVHLALNLVSEGVNRRISVLACMIFLAGG